VAALLLLAVVRTSAQEAETPVTSVPGVQSAPAGEHDGAPWGMRGRFGRGEGGGTAERFARRLFRIAPEDRGPLRPGEEQELLTFARARLPRIAEALETLQQRDPEKFRERLAEHAPRLRHLRRIYDLSPRLGDILRTYSLNLVEIERRSRDLTRGEAASAERDQQVAALRERLAENVRLECEGLETLAGQLEDRRAERTAERLANLTTADVDPAALPPHVRDLVAAYQNAATDEERAAAREKLQVAAAQHVDLEIAALRERAAHMRQRAEEETDRRLERVLEGRGREERSAPPHGEEGATPRERRRS
jgi:hypothetical protein